MIEIKNRYTGTVIFTSKESTTMLEAVKDAIKSSADLRYANLSYADLRYAELRSANLSSADLRYAELRSANLSYANLSYADLSYANLRSADLSYAKLSYADLRSADLSYAKLRSADLSSANLSYADLRCADLSSADLSSAELRSADLISANLSSAELRYANLRYANLSSADLSYAELRSIRNDFWDVLIRAQHEVKGLRAALVEGRVDGSTYEGECACLVGTIANVKHCPYHAIETLKPDSNRPIERFFLAISKGSTPENNAACKIAVEWIDEFQSLIHSEVEASK